MSAREDLDPFAYSFTNIVFFFPDLRKRDRVTQGQPRINRDVEKAVSRRSPGSRQWMFYVHIPYCRHICYFCGYHRKRCTDPQVLDRYVDRVITELELWAQPLRGADARASVLYFGGGTPSILSPKQFQRLVSQIQNLLPVDSSTEFDVEIDLPSLNDHTMLETLKGAGVTRISFGVQSLDPVVRKTAGLDTFGDADQIRQGIENLSRLGYGANFDLMFGLPDQTLESFLYDIEQAIGPLDAEHVDLLEYFVQPDSYFARNFDAIVDRLPSKENRREMYMQASKVLRANGYRQTTMTDFWKETRKAGLFKRLLYHNGNIIGFGASAQGFIGDCAYRNARLDEGYLTQPASGSTIAYVRPLKPELLRMRSMLFFPKLMRFRLEDISVGATELEVELLQRFVDAGYLERRKKDYRVTDHGLLNSGAMLLETFRNYLHHLEN
jgi:oxygen-independent coproporphyrinogen-3 oxidase